MLTLLALALVGQAAVRVDAAGPLAEAIGGRLLEEGYRLVPAADDADVEVVSTATGTGLHLAVRRASAPPERRWIEAGPAGAVRLELLQQAVLLVRAASPLAPRPRRAGSAVLRIEGPAAAALWPRLAARALAARLAVAAAPIDGDRVVCAVADAATVAWAVIDAGHACPALGAPRARDLDERWMDEVIAALGAAPRATASPDESTLALSVSLAGGASLRAGGVDPSASVALGVGGRAGLGGALRVGFTGSAGARTLRVTELTFTAGPCYAWALGARLTLEVGLAAGVRVHAWSVDAAAEGFAVPSGARVDPLGELPVRLSARLVGPLALDLWLTPGLGGGGRTHASPGGALWERSALQAVAGLGVSGALGTGNSAGPGE